MDWGNYLVSTSDPNLLNDYLADFIGDPVVTINRVPKVGDHYMAVISVDCASVESVCDGCGRRQCPGCGSSVIVDLDAGTVLCVGCRRQGG